MEAALLSLDSASHAAATTLVNHTVTMASSSSFSTPLVCLWGNGTGDVSALTMFTGLICVCIVVGHLLENLRWINESVLSIIFGLIIGAIVLFIRKGKSSLILRFDEEVFFLYLLPPIIFNAGFQVKKKQFFRNFGAIMTYGIVGVFISFGVISAGCQALFQLVGLPEPPGRIYLVLGAIFSATDSVCTLQVLNQEEQPLVYSLVFGEGIVNDATSVVLFRAVQKLGSHSIDLPAAASVLSNFLYLFISSTVLGIGALPSNLCVAEPMCPPQIGLCSAFLIRTLYLARHSTDREIALVAGMAYLSYVVSEQLQLSGILSVFFAGITMSHYTWHNVTESSRVTTKHAFATLSFLAETFIFIYVGMDALDTSKLQQVRLGPAVALFCLLLLLVLVSRAAFVFPLSALLNLKRNPSRMLQPRHQVIVWWSGLMRGAVSIALTYEAFSDLPDQKGEFATMIASTMAVVLFSTVVFGLLTAPLIHFFLPLHLQRCSSTLSDSALSPPKGGGGREGVYGEASQPLPSAGAPAQWFPPYSETQALDAIPGTSHAELGNQTGLAGALTVTEVADMAIAGVGTGRVEERVVASSILGTARGVSQGPVSVVGVSESREVVIGNGVREGLESEQVLQADVTTFPSHLSKKRMSSGVSAVTTGSGSFGRVKEGLGAHEGEAIAGEEEDAALPLPLLQGAGQSAFSARFILPSSVDLSRIFTARERDVHDWWRWFDDSYMRPVFGGRGFIGSPSMQNLYHVSSSHLGQVSAVRDSHNNVGMGGYAGRGEVVPSYQPPHSAVVAITTAGGGHVSSSSLSSSRVAGMSQQLSTSDPNQSAAESQPQQSMRHSGSFPRQQQQQHSMSDVGRRRLSWSSLVSKKGSMNERLMGEEVGGSSSMRLGIEEVTEWDGRHVKLENEGDAIEGEDLASEDTAWPGRLSGHGHQHHQHPSPFHPSSS